MRSLSILLINIILLSSVFGLASCGSSGNEQNGRPPVPVSVGLVHKEDVPYYLETIGNAVALKSVNIVPQVSGTILETHFQQGADVKKGELLFSIDPRPYIATLHDAESRLAKDAAELALNEAQLKRSLNLASANYVSSQDLDTIKAKVESSRASIKGDQAMIETAKINLEYCSIRSPIDGVAGKYQVDAGNVVSSSNTVTLVSIQDIDNLYIDFTIPEKDFSEIHSALGEQDKLPVEIQSLSNPDLKGTGYVKYLDNKIQSGTGTVALRAVLDNHRRIFWPGQAVKLRIILKMVRNALAMPYQALQIGQQGPFVFVVDDKNTAQIRTVSPGQKQGEIQIINNGLNEGDKVVLTGHLMLAPGAPVMILPPQGGSDLQAANASAIQTDTK